MTRAPDYSQPVVGWRLWSVAGDVRGARLASHVCPVVWEPGRELVAACDAGRRELRRPWRVRPTEHAAPSLRCTCGVHAMGRVGYLSTYLPLPNRPYAWMRPPVHQVIGRVSLWGEVVEGTRGWRASHGYPAELWLPQLDLNGDAIAGAGSIATELADYGVPVHVYHGLTARGVVDELNSLRTAGRQARPRSRSGGRGWSSRS